MLIGSSQPIDEVAVLAGEISNDPVGDATEVELLVLLVLPTGDTEEDIAPPVTAVTSNGEEAALVLILLPSTVPAR